MHGPVSSSASRTGAARASDEVQVDARATGAVPHPEARHDADANTDHPPVMMFRGRQGTTAGHRGETLVPTAACRYELPHAKVAELADAQDSGSCGLNTRGGSSPPFRTSQVREHPQEPQRCVLSLSRRAPESCGLRRALSCP